MPVPFHGDSEIEELGAAAFLKIEADTSSYRGALFLINCRGEPLEFTHTHIEIPNTFLWRKVDVQRHAVRKITTSLFSLCAQVPRLIFCLAAEINTELFYQDIRVSVPVCRIASSLSAISFAPNDTKEETKTSESSQLFWLPARPAEASNEYRLFQKLLSSGLLAEPFERATAGLHEVYK